MPARRKKRAAKSKRAARAKKKRVFARKGRTAARRPKHKRKVTVRVTYHHKRGVPAPDRHFGTKRALAYMVFAIALAIGITAFYDAAYYTGYVVLPEGQEHILAAADGSGGTAAGETFTLAASLGEAVVGKGSGERFTLTLGAMGFLGGDVTAPSCTIEQSTGTPAEGAGVMLTAVCTDDTGLAQIVLYTDESGVMAKITDYGSPASVSGTEATAIFMWDNPEITVDTTVKWKVMATDTSGNEGESTTLAFTVGGVPDLTEPGVGTPIVTPAAPGEGETVSISVQLTDDIGLASADLIANGEVVDSVAVSGTSATAEFSWTAGPVGTYILKVAASDGAGNSAESAQLTVSVVSAVCDPALKPADVLGDCVNGLRTRTTYICDPSTRTWKPLELTEACEAPAPVAFIAVGVVALVIALAAALYILKRRPKGPAKKPVPPATFG